MQMDTNSYQPSMKIQQVSTNDAPIFDGHVEDATIDSLSSMFDGDVLNIVPVPENSKEFDWDAMFAGDTLNIFTILEEGEK